MTAAGELARAGCAVTLFERGPALGGKAGVVREGGVTLDTGPTLLTLPEVVREGFRRLDATDLLPRFVELDTHAAYHFPDGRQFTAHRALGPMVASAEALGPKEGAGLRAFYDDASEIFEAAGEPYLEAPMGDLSEFVARVARRGVKALWRGAQLGTLAGLAARHFGTPHLRHFAGHFATYAGASPYEASAAFALIPHIERAFGVHHVEGGMGALAAALHQGLSRLGVEVRLGTAARSQADGARFLAGPPDALQPFDAVVVNTDPLTALGRADEPLGLSGYVLLVSVDRRLPLPHHSVAFPPDVEAEFHELFAGKLATRPTLYVCHPVATDATLAPAGTSGLYLMVHAPPLRHGLTVEAEAHAWRERLIGLRAYCLAGLRSLCPEVVGAAVRVLGERTPADFARRDCPRGSIYGFLPHGRLGAFQRPRIRGHVPGLFYAGGGTHPGGGVPMVMLSGRFAAQLAAQHLELSG